MNRSGVTGVCTGMGTSRPSDEVLTIRAQLGDREALSELVAALHQPIADFLDHLSGHRDVADDLAQETWLRALRALPSLRQPASVRPWLFTIARRVATDRLRTEARRAAVIDDRAELVEEPVDPTAVDEIDRWVERADLATLIDGLDLELGEIIGLYYGQRFSVTEIGRIVGVPPGTVKSRLHRARRELARLHDRPDRASCRADPGPAGGRSSHPDADPDLESETRPDAHPDGDRGQKETRS